MGFIDQWKQGRHEKVQSRAWDAFACNDVAALSNELDAGASADLLNGAGQTLVHRMILEDRPLMERPLSRPEVSWTLALPDGRTPLHLAVESGQSRWLRAVLNKGVPVDAQTLAGHTALHLAARAGATPLIRMLDGAGASWSVKDKRLQTPLDVLAMHTILHGAWCKLLTQRKQTP